MGTAPSRCRAGRRKKVFELYQTNADRERNAGGVAQLTRQAETRGSTSDGGSAAPCGIPPQGRLSTW